MKKELEHFIYSQNSINTYKSCPRKFKLKYIENLNWKKDDINSKEYYEGLITGSEFHLICERYFENIPLGIDKENNETFYTWIQNIKKILPIENNKIYLPEYEVRMNINKSIISAKYDLVIIDKDNIEIWDWKTENKQLEYKNLINRMQTIVYMFIAKEVIPKINNLDSTYENISMKYYQPQFGNNAITINYTEEIHEENRESIKKYIEFINNSEFNFRNNNHCKYCEFNKLCNNEEVIYEQLEEEIYER